MKDQAEQQRRRQGLRSILLLGILGLMVLMAWGIAHYRREPSRQAADILDEIRKRGLGEYWPSAEEQVQWRLIRRNGREAGWEVRYRRPRKGGGYEGEYVQYDNELNGTRHINSSAWSLDNDMATGLYRSHEREETSTRTSRQISATIIRQANTQIQLDNETIKMNRREGRVEQSGSAGRPENYIPEGTMELMYARVADRGEEAVFSVIFDSDSLSTGGESIRFFRLLFSPQPAGEGGKAVRVVNSSMRQGPGTIVELSAEGRVQKVSRTLLYQDGSTTTIVTVASDREEVETIYPRAVRIADQSRYRLRPELFTSPPPEESEEEPAQPQDADATQAPEDDED